MKPFTHFLVYNNTIPILFGVLFLGAGATFAASPEARQTVVGSEARLASVDNSYLLNTTINDSTVQVTVGSVTEDSEKYYVEYQITNIEVLDGAWRPVTNTKVFEVSKDSIVGRDLGLYAAEELGEVQALYVRRLKEYQDIDRRGGITPKAIATEYSGLVGQFLDPQLEVFPEYDPFLPPSEVAPASKEWLAEQKRLKNEEKREEDRFVTNEGTQITIPDIGVGNDQDNDEVTPPPEDSVIKPESATTTEPALESDPVPIPEPQSTPASDPEPEPSPL